MDLTNIIQEKQKKDIQRVNYYLNRCMIQLEELDDGFIYYELVGFIIDNNQLLKFFNRFSDSFNEFKLYLDSIDWCNHMDYGSIDYEDLYDYFNPLFTSINRYKEVCNDLKYYGSIYPTFEYI